MAKFQVVYIDSRPGDYSMEEAILEKADAELVLASCRNDDEVAAVAAGADGIINTMYWMNRQLFERLSKLKVVVRGGVGYDNLDVEAGTDLGIVLCNVHDYSYNEVANHAFAMLLCLNRKLVALDRAVRDGTRIPPPAIMAHTGRVAGQTLGLVSLGNIARAVAQRAQGFDMRVIAHDPFVDAAKAAALGVTLVSLDDLMRESDYISVHTPLSAKTAGMVGAHELSLMKPSAYIVTTARGGIIAEDALADSLREHRIAGAGIDVWQNEPVQPDNPLLALDNVLASHHFGWYSDVSPMLLRQRTAEAMADVLRGVMPRSVVNPAVLERVALAPRAPDAD
jgi:D-3-phosphoglycerate dehydrogenase